MGGTAFAWSVIELVVFTALAPAAAVAYGIVASRFILLHADDRATPPPATALMMPLALVTVGFVVSATHLGNPSNALYVFVRVGRAGLSSEVLSCGVFLALGGTFWIAALLRRPPKTLENLWLVASVAAMVAYLVCTTRAYHMPTIPTWGTAEAQASLVFEALAGGALLARAILSWDARHGTRASILGRHEGLILASCSVTLGVVTCVILVLQHGRIATISNIFGTGADLVPHYLVCVALYGIGLLAANALVELGARRIGRGADVMLAVGSALLLVVTLVVRFEFYATYLALA